MHSKEQVSEGDDHTGKFEELLTKLITALKGHHSTETRHQTKTDRLLLGLLKLIERVLTVKSELREKVADREGHNLIEFIFKTCLFDLENSSDKLENYTEETERATGKDKNYVKCKSKESR